MKCLHRNLTIIFSKVNAYNQRTFDLQRQQAALEIVTHIRKVVDHFAFEHFCVGNFIEDELHLRIVVKEEPNGHFPLGKALWNVLIRKSLDEQKTVLEQILAPYVESGDMPAFRIEEDILEDNPPHLVIYYDFAM